MSSNETTPLKSRLQLLRMAGYHPYGHVVGRHCVWAPGLVFANIPSGTAMSYELGRVRADWESRHGRHERGCVSLTIAQGLGCVCPAGTQPHYRPAGKP